MPIFCEVLNNWDETFILGQDSRELVRTESVIIRQLRFLRRYFSPYLLNFMLDFTRDSASGGRKTRFDGILKKSWDQISVLTESLDISVLCSKVVAK